MVFLKWETEWCDTEFGWGPFVDWSLTPCFSSTMLEIPVVVVFFVIGAPRMATLIYEIPEVKPARSLFYYLKLFCSLAAFASAIIMTMFVEPRSLSNVVALALTAFAWFLSLTLLVLGYHRAEPQKYLGLRFWWVSEFIVQAVIFAEFSILKPGKWVHIFRGVYLFCCICLVTLNLKPIDQAPYEEVVLEVDTGMVSPNSNNSLSRIDNNDIFILGPTDQTPLLSHAAGTLRNDTISNHDDEEGQADEPPRKLDRRLSSRIFITGASTSDQRGLFEAWNKELNNLESSVS
uniref:ABC transporter TMD0 domain-containing protein n=1 Tax=Aplanochytrium stocchinoi TaxID=215587 RepID=A0A7S3PND7_9STRA